jgi:hypothetical protein
VKRDLELKSPPFPDAVSAVAGFAAIVEVLLECGARVRPTCGLHLHAQVPGVTDRMARRSAECWPDPVGTFQEMLAHQRRMLPIYEERRRQDYLVAVAVVEHWLPVQERFLEMAYPHGRGGPDAARLAYAEPLGIDDVRCWARQCPNGFSNENVFGKRHRALNLCAVAKHGTLECRLFPATLDAQRFGAFMALWSSWCASLDPAALEARVPDLARHADEAARDWEAFMATVQRYIERDAPLFARDDEMERRARRAGIPVPRRRRHEYLRDWSRVVWPDGTVGIPADLLIDGR